MGSLKFHKLQTGKSNSILKHRQLRKIANLLRHVELFVVLILIYKLSFQLPVAIKNSREYFQGFSGFMVSPCFVFLIGNIIIITLFAQSGHFSAQASAKDCLESDLYQEFLQNSISFKNQIIQANHTKHLKKQSKETEDIKQIQNIDGDRVRSPKKVITTENNQKGRRIDGFLIKYPEKQCIKPSNKTEDIIKDQRIIDGGMIKREEKDTTKTNTTSLDVKDYRRCQTDIIRRVQQNEVPRRVLHRCETEKSRGSIEPEKEARVSYPEDDMSNDEFRRTIEAFIARQQRLRRQEQ